MLPHSSLKTITLVNAFQIFWCKQITWECFSNMDPDSAGLGWSWVCISGKIPGDANTAGPTTTFWVRRGYRASMCSQYGFIPQEWKTDDTCFCQKTWAIHWSAAPKPNQGYCCHSPAWLTPSEQSHMANQLTWYCMVHSQLVVSEGAQKFK